MYGKDYNIVSLVTLTGKHPTEHDPCELDRAAAPPQHHVMHVTLECGAGVKLRLKIGLKEAI